MSDYSTTAGALTASARELGDYDTSNPAGQYISDGFLMRRTSANYKVAYELLATADPDRVTTVSTYTTTSATGSIPLPTDMYRLRAIDVSVGGTYLRLIRDDPSALNSPWELPLGTFVPGITGVPGRYRTEGPNAFVSPNAAANVTFRFTYVPNAAALTGSDQVIDGVAGVDELTSWMTVRDCRLREEKSTAEAEVHIKDLRQRIQEMAQDRDSGQPKRLEDPMVGGFRRRSRLGGRW